MQRQLSHCSLLFSFILLSLLVSCSTPSPSKKFQTNPQVVEEALDFLLGNLKTNLLASNAFVLYSAQGLVTSQEARLFNFNPQLQKNFKEVVGQFLGGPQIYKSVKDYYRTQLGEEKILASYQLFQTQEIAKIFAKEVGDLNPENFQKFLIQWQKDKKLEDKAQMIDALDDLSQISTSNILVVKEIGTTLGHIKKLITKPSVSITLGEDESEEDHNNFKQETAEAESKEGLAMFEMQTRYLTSEVLRYTYQNLDLQELKQLHNVLGATQTQEFYQLVPESIHQAYRHAYKDLKGEFAKFAQKTR